eukprot:3518407-Alexandrium_andersonii.AAC.1
MVTQALRTFVAMARCVVRRPFHLQSKPSCVAQSCGQHELNAIGVVHRRAHWAVMATHSVLP